MYPDVELILAHTVPEVSGVRLLPDPETESVRSHGGSFSLLTGMSLPVIGFSVGWPESLQVSFRTLPLPQRESQSVPSISNINSFFHYA